VIVVYTSEANEVTYGKIFKVHDTFRYLQALDRWYTVLTERWGHGGKICPALESISLPKGQGSWAQLHITFFPETPPNLGLEFLANDSFGRARRQEFSRLWEPLDNSGSRPTWWVSLLSTLQSHQFSPTFHAPEGSHLSPGILLLPSI
jgi:hypothetical protein